MNEPKAGYEVEDNIQNAMEMLGSGYETVTEIVQEVSGFTPIFDLLVSKYDDLICS